MLVVANLKGGAGKTTIAAKLAAYFAKDMGKRVLLVDLGFQASLSSLVLQDEQRLPKGYLVHCATVQKSAYLRRFRSSTSEGVQLGQVAIYCRVSTDDQSCVRQEHSPGALATHDVVSVFKETASGAKNDRAEGQKVMAHAQAREIDAILVTELSRSGRSTQGLRPDARRPP